MNGVKYWNGGQVFHSEQFGEIRTVSIDENPWWVGKDVAAALGYKNTKDALSRHVDDEDKRGSRFTTPSGEQELTVINESGLYSLILSSKLPTAKAFKRWVTSEVLPAIRQHGIFKAISIERMRDPLSKRRPAPVGPLPVNPTRSPSPTIPTAPLPERKPEISIGEALKAVELVVKCKPDRLPYALEILRQTGFNFPKGGENHG